LNIRPSTFTSGSGGATGQNMGWRNGTVTNLEALDITCIANKETIKDCKEKPDCFGLGITYLETEFILVLEACAKLT
jgi:hypothetical protein